jgi:hypothetical protein
MDLQKGRPRMGIRVFRSANTQEKLGIRRSDSQLCKLCYTAIPIDSGGFIYSILIRFNKAKGYLVGLTRPVQKSTLCTLTHLD